MTIMLSELADRWAEVFSILGSEERLSILFVLQGSLFVRHKHTEVNDEEPVGSLSFSQIAEAAGLPSSTRLSYHLSKLMQADLVQKIPYQDSKGRVFPLYTITDKWRAFSNELGIENIISSQIHKKYPDAYQRPARC